MGAAASLFYTDAQMVSCACNDETLEQSSNDEDHIILTEQEGPYDTGYPVSQERSEVSCIVCTCPQTQFINIMGANCRNVVCLPVPEFSYVKI